MKNYDYIIIGAGASGLMLAYRMALDSFFNDKTILIIDKEKDKGNDRTWSYWEKGIGEWDDILLKAWDNVYFGSENFSEIIPIKPYKYKTLQSAPFYKKLWYIIEQSMHITFIQDEVISFNSTTDYVEIIGRNGNYTAHKLFNSIMYNDTYLKQMKYPVLQQHFLGWFIKINQPLFDDTLATFMDFNLEQNGNTCFMYVLPFTKDYALFEYTLFSESLLEKSEYEEAIKSYLHKKNISNYTIVEQEFGSIPMTAYKFEKHNTKHILNIGTAGGWTKASTGYTFSNTGKKTKELISFLKHETDLSKFPKHTKYRFYDTILLDVLAQHNAMGAHLFSSLFKKANIKTIFTFLNEESSLLQDLEIILSVPKAVFNKALFKRLF